MSKFETLARRTLAFGGGTAWPDGTLRDVRQGYYVGGLVPSGIVPHIPDAQYLMRAIDAFMAQHAATFALPCVCVGLWVDGDNVYIDASEWEYDRELALRNARERGELAIWDCAKQEEVRL